MRLTPYEKTYFIFVVAGVLLLIRGVAPKTPFRFFLSMMSCLLGALPL